VSQLVFCKAHQVPGYSDQASPTWPANLYWTRCALYWPPTRLGHETRRKMKMRTLLAPYSARPRGKTQWRCGLTIWHAEDNRLGSARLQTIWQVNKKSSGHGPDVALRWPLS